MEIHFSTTLFKIFIKIQIILKNLKVFHSFKLSKFILKNIYFKVIFYIR
ncbi:hypothetical protein LEP1GSC021_1899 [Leptospira noguchii str. 1993005606]|uniref:Uncharacterized protein n=2 Tax=Leptospira noguchii TaxID=28182 RepID=M6YKR5_9LEPT|nr:hypothetical protein LEP1GSC035_0573 [Leptospira noguchii str. 2007001578]EMO90164.1 hypothetical protein LEP1GSC024_4148 [Leptospira noguchii str. 2001034031]EPE86414.1 hypothetical protein LEP1GSC021_1899 [Leptospira noguchii str. 1993005606]